jgi:transposase-like protein
MPKMLTIQDFFRMFPDNETCLSHLFYVRFGPDYQCERCGQTGQWKRLRKMPAYTCNCGNHVHPMAGTPFLRTRTPLQKWFYAMFLFTTTRNGVAAKELQRQLGVTYKTAWRMAKEIRTYMAIVDGDEMLGGPGRGVVEADKAFIGGKDKIGEDDKTVVLGMAERRGDVITRVIPDRSQMSVLPHIARNVLRGSRVATDEASSFSNVGFLGYRHATVNHREGEYVRGPVHTNTIEAFWAMVKRTISGTHIWVSPKHLPKYLGEIEFRWNLRKNPEAMFPALLRGFLGPSR